MSRRAVRLVVVPASLFTAVSGAVLVLAILHPATDDATAGGSALAGEGDVANGAALFAANCAGCHGNDGAGGGVGPALAGNPITLADARETIENGRGIMPGGLVEGSELDDVLAYLETIMDTAEAEPDGG
jgi:mono/diheme cytochrome c family protein